MTKTIIQVSGMACSMCESHVNNAIRSAFSVDKVTSSHTKGETVVISKDPLDEKAIHAVLDPTGYTVGAITSEPYEKKGFSLFGRNK